MYVRNMTCMCRAKRPISVPGVRPRIVLTLTLALRGTTEKYCTYDTLRL